MSKRLTAIFPCILLCLVFLMGVAKVWDGDAWWHLKTGELIVTSRSLPERDPFSHTNDRRWVHDEWLGDVVLHTARRLGGLAGLILFTAAVGAAIFLVAYLTSRAEGSGRAAAAIFLTAAAFAARSRLAERPEIFGLLFAAVFIYILRLETQKGKSPLFLLPPLQILWVNTHPGAMIGAVFVLVTAVSLWLNGKLGRAGNGSIKKLFIVFLLCVIACLINPYGLHGLTAPFKFINTPVFMRHIAEWSPVTWKEFAGPGGGMAFHSFRFLLLFGALTFALRWRRAQVGQAALFLLTAAMALKSHRFIGLFAIVAAPAVAAQFSQFAYSLNPSRAARAALTAACLFAMLGGGYRAVLHSPPYAFGLGEHRDFPSGAAKFLDHNRDAFPGNMYNAYEYGGYLIYRLHPRFRVFIDGRTTFYGEEFYGRVIDFEAFPEPEKWKNLVNEHGLRFAVLSAEQRAVGRVVAADPEWALVFWDDRALVYLRRGPETPAFIAESEYIYTDTFMALGAALWAIGEGGQAAAAVREELERPFNRGDLSPNPIGLHALGYMEHRLGNLERAERALALLTRMEPRLGGPHGLLGSIYLDQGRKEEAIREFRKAAARLPKFREVLRQMDSTGEEEKPETE